MRQQITVDKAIKRGHLMVNVPVLMTFIGCPALALYLKKQNLIPGWGIGIAFLIGFVLAWLIWSFMITKWRIWAFENVRNVHELKKKAIQEKLIWHDGCIFEKTEIRSRKDKDKLKKLEKKFEQEDEYKEDYSLPPKMEIHYSKTKIYFELAISILIIGVGIYLFTNGETKRYILLGAIMTGIGLYGTIKELRKAFDRKPKIIIDSKGIQTENVEFKNWSNIENEEVIQEGFGSSAKFYLTYYYDEDGFEKMEIDSLDVTPRELENIIRTYRIRNNKNFR
jgi:hypothetical protein